MLAFAQRDGLQRGSRKGLIAARLLLKGSRVKALKAVRRQIARSINALIAQESKERASKGRAEQDDKRMLALTILLFPRTEFNPFSLSWLDGTSALSNIVPTPGFLFAYGRFWRGFLMSIV